MHDIYTQYERFCSLMEDYAIYINPLLRFRDIARFLDTPPHALDRIIQDEIGISGTELLYRYRQTYGERLSRMLRHPLQP